MHIKDSILRYGTRAAIIWSPDTDVLILGVYFSGELDIDMWFKTGTEEKVRYIPMHEISIELGQELTSVLLAFHAVTGCDSTSYFKGRGKKRSLSILRNSTDKFQSLKNLGDVFPLTNELISVCESFICRLYEVKSYANDINLLRYNISCKKPQHN